MSTIFTYLRGYALMIDKALLFFCMVWMSILIALNYRLGIEQELIKALDSRFDQWLALFLVYCSAFIVPYIFVIVFRKQQVTTPPMFWTLLLIAPVLFAIKVSVVNPLENEINGIWGAYLTSVTTLPFKCLVVLIPLIIIYKLLPVQPSFWGFTLQGVEWRVYGWMLVLMMPLILFASTQADFLNAYPRLKQIAFIESHTNNPLWYQLLYEISYGVDFITIELFFRGFLVFAFARYVGAAAILPMATFYCSIHFGKPLFECISSFFGGLVLGMIASRTQSIVGGLTVHLGVAWMMEIGGYWGNLWMR